MSIQEIIVYLIIAACIAYTIYSIIKIFIKKDKSACNCSSCDIKDDLKDLKIHSDILKKVS